MTICLRVCSAYSLRLSRRHSTLCLTTLLISSLLTILLFYSNRKYHFHRINIGDFDYQPGLFLKDYPVSNISYCKFNYGLPYSLDWTSVHIHFTPEHGSKSSYRVIYNAIQGTAYNQSNYETVTYATQATPEFLYHILEVIRYWEGPVSLAVFVPSYDLALTMQVFDQLCHCYDAMDKLSVHLFYPKNHPPIFDVEPKTEAITSLTESPQIQLERKLSKYKNLTHETRANYIKAARENKIKSMMSRISKKLSAPRLTFSNCSTLSQMSTYRRYKNLIYPINVGRNVARNASTSNYFLVSDIEMVPSSGLASKFLNMVSKLMGDSKRKEGCIYSRTVFVVPLFEVERGVVLPRDKETLVRLIEENSATYFHQKTCPHCQRFPGLQTWLTRPALDIVEPMLIGKRVYPYHRWEPLYFGTKKEPWYNEDLSWEGRQDKMAQMLEMCLQQYRMVVLDGGFLTHAATTKSSVRNNRAEIMNARRYNRIVRELKKKYKELPQCKVK